MNHILVTGAAGNLGGRVLAALHRRGVPVRALVRHDDRAGALVGSPEVVVGDYDDHHRLTHALSGVHRVFLVSANGPAQVAQECAVIDAAVDAGVSLVVKVSAHGADPEAPVGFWRAHAAVERHLAQSGIRSVVLRPTYLMSNLLGEAPQVRQHGLLPSPPLSAPLAMVDPDDVADVAAHVLLGGTGPDVTQRTLHLTGPEPVTLGAVATLLGEIAGHPVQHLAAPPEQAQAAMRAQGVAEPVVAEILRLFAALDQGAYAATTTTVADILGRAPRDVRDFLHRHAHLFQPAA
ncbi:NAD(P)H-binding protein [Phycicoccus sp. MAQZ13P-2]|uniref:NmrA family NAD(P)-binding protein n=1 Tax=Phycicoccus mangrovi TaxID=2840470 RepID=UPI001BFFF38E|nr:NAD(P)H-binding protein [Phycicoccus mangrovi]MBT9257700.1 NAD(P)H-binding protein [Phycicoccus mangrovi]MBT9273648.1 NAD(P)H-binding protein [Phycicoccus mangrovi]